MPKLLTQKEIKAKLDRSARKICPQCKQAKTKSEFGKSASKDPEVAKDGMFITCRPCRKQIKLEDAIAEKIGEDNPNEVIIAEARARRDLLRKSAVKAAQRYHKEEVEIDAKLAIKKELTSRKLARRRLLAYVIKFTPGYNPGWVHKDICRRLEVFLQRVANGESPRLILCMPPRHGKSELASKQFPAWALGKYPHFEIIAASYAVTLPLGFSRKVRARIRDDKVNQAIFPEVKLNPEATNAEGWETTAGGGYVPAGVGGSITGKGAHILIIDDPVKDAQEADSPTVRDTTWDWWGATAKTRLAPGGGVLVIQTRWHDDDLAGRLLQQREELIQEIEALSKDIEERRAIMMESGTPDEKAVEALDQEMQGVIEMREEIDDWELINYPGIAENDEFLCQDDMKVYDHPVPNCIKLRSKGDALHPERFSRGRLMNMKRTMQPRHWSALYQQNPVPDEGLFFTNDLFRFRPSVNTMSHDGQIRLAAVDLAIAEKQMNDRTVVSIGILNWDNTTTVVDVVAGRWGTYGIVDTICNALQRWDVDILGIENGALKMAIMPILLRELAARNISVSFDDTLTPITDKATRARPLQGLMQQGRWFMLNNDTWMPATMAEMLRFPGGAFDDRVDSLAWLARMSLNVTAPPRPKHEASTESDWRKRLRQQTAMAQGSRYGGAMGA